MSILRLRVPPADWRWLALCAQVGGDLFFPEKGESARPAKAICARCTVRRPCLEFALEHEIRHGIWGGLSDHQRRRLTAGTPRMCRNGLHPMDEVNARVGEDGHETCRACRAAGQRRFEAARKAAA